MVRGGLTAMAFAAAMGGAASAAEMDKLPILEHLQGMGISTCINRVNDFVDILDRSSSGYGAVFIMPAEAQNEHIFSMSIEVELPNAVQFVTMTAAPVRAGACELNVQTVTAGQCPDTMGLGKVLQKRITVDEPRFTQRTFFMPLPSGGCNIITNEVLY